MCFYSYFQYEEANELALGNNKIKFHDQEELIDKLRKKSEKFHRDLQYCLDHLGLWCAYKVCEGILLPILDLVFVADDTLFIFEFSLLDVQLSPYQCTLKIELATNRVGLNSFSC